VSSGTLNLAPPTNQPPINQIRHNDHYHALTAALILPWKSDLSNHQQCFR